MNEQNLVIDSVGGYEAFDQLVKRGKQMHDQAVFELFAGMLSKAFASFKKGRDQLATRQGKADYRPMRYARQ